MRSSLLFLPLTLALASCGGPGPDRDEDGFRDTIDCAPEDATAFPGADDTCDGVDSDCNGVVDDGSGVAHGLMYRDEDHDGFGTLAAPDFQGCERPGWVAAETHPELDCDDANADSTPVTPITCDYDFDGAPGATDCDDHDPNRKPGIAEQCNGIDDDCDGAVDDADQTGWWGGGIYVLDADHDTYPSASLQSCTAPGGAWEAVSLVNETDCAPNDPLIHPNRPDDCATMTDRDCSGAFEPVYVVGGYASASEVAAIRAAFTAAGPGQPPTHVDVGGYSGATITLCPGTYRVQLQLGGAWGYLTSYEIRGLGASPADVVLDGGGTGRVVAVSPWQNLDQEGGTSARLENLTIANGHPSEGAGGCVAMFGPSHGAGLPDLDLDDVAFTGCSADDGGAVSLGGFGHLTIASTTFANCSATGSGGAIAFSGVELAMTGGSFSGTTAPSGGAIAATLANPATLSLTGVDLSAITNDVAVTIGASTLSRDLGASAALSCTSAGCTP